jgi:hypothetical protein
MLLPNRENAYLPTEKLTKYLLSQSHPVGQSKARFFAQYGFHAGNADVLREVLLGIARNNDVVYCEDKPFGRHYIIDGDIVSPSGTIIRIRTAWILEADSIAPRFVTAFPR